ncbi:protein PHYTOCHROME KINASE SUBSTRATE 1-like [Henckelia pumila]|uniref:protein PHYTOCHROME KINASE SUBSTRATE 1-like n=1 Tax=Henckelia pumila TaxID=405737 RepID=UPI003C6E4D60
MAMPVISLTLSNNSNARRDASFSSYLNENEESFVLSLSGRKKTEDKEIDVFDAHKYFNEGTNQTCKIVKNLKNFPYVDQGRKDDPFEFLSVKTRRWTSSRSVRSESSCKSSCNSRSRLMHGTVSRNQQPGKMNKRITFLDVISCSCIGKDSNDIHDYVAENWKSGPGDKSRDLGGKNSESGHNCVKSDEPGLRLNSDNHFSFPVFSPNYEEDGNNKRKSLEVFGSPELDDRIYSRGLEKKFNMFAWNAVSPGRAVNQIKIPPISGGIDFDETRGESDSDASSETFETESMPKNRGLSLSRQGSDSLSGRNYYAPSEASAEWSVITASAADFSALSDSDDAESTASAARKPGKKVKNSSSTNAESPKVGSIFLSGCKNQKAVRVAGNVHKPDTKAHFPSARGFQKHPVSRFSGENKVMGSSAKIRKPSFEGQKLSRSRSGGAKNLLYIM